MSLTLHNEHQGDERPHEHTNMANFARSFKSPSYLSPRRRPNLAGRTFSNSSDLSLASNNSGQHDEPGDWELSAPNTPGLPAADERPQATGKPILDPFPCS